jgi:hypothetical protein
MKNGSERIGKLGRRLSLLASTGQAALIIATLFGLTFAFALYKDSPRPGDLFAPVTLVPTLANVATAAIYFWVLQRLHRVGTVLRHGPPISADLGTALGALGRAILWSTLVVLLLGIPEARTIQGVPTLTYRTEPDWSLAYLGAIAAVSLFAISRVIGEAVRLREDNEAIV